MRRDRNTQGGKSGRRELYLDLPPASRLWSTIYFIPLPVRPSPLLCHFRNKESAGEADAREDLHRTERFRKVSSKWFLSEPGGYPTFESLRPSLLTGR